MEETLNFDTVNKYNVFNNNKTLHPLVACCFNVPVGHQSANLTFKFGVRHQVAISKKAVTLKEIR